jgi:uncharacterized membrane protein
MFDEIVRLLVFAGICVLVLFVFLIVWGLQMKRENRRKREERGSDYEVPPGY